tara:strand:- start:602 stop:745 length:144 start_codon:yes stop_codon:yes gene_type:complete
MTHPVKKGLEELEVEVLEELPQAALPQMMELLAMQTLEVGVVLEVDE